MAKVLEERKIKRKRDNSDLNEVTVYGHTTLSARSRLNEVTKMHNKSTNKKDPTREVNLGRK